VPPADLELATVMYCATQHRIAIRISNDGN